MPFSKKDNSPILYWYVSYAMLQQVTQGITHYFINT
jgi:hypothetical protein